MNDGTSLNLSWLFSPHFDPAYLAQTSFAGFAPVHLPHTVRELPYDCFDETLTCLVSTYVRFFDLPDIADKRVLLEFEGVSAAYELYVNGEQAGSHKGAYSTALFDISGFVHPGQNQLLLRVDSHERADIPPNGSTVDFLIYGGIYRDVTLYIKPAAYIRRALLRYELEGQNALVAPALRLENHGEAFEADVCLEVEGHDVYASLRWRLQVPAGGGDLALPAQVLDAVSLWDTENPTLYSATFKLYSADATAAWQPGQKLDECHQKVGFRSVEVTPKGFYLNGERTKLIGLNRHQSWPYVGYAMGKRPQQKDADILKFDLGLNTVRCSHYMQSRHFLDRCDEIGLLAIEEIPGWGFIGGEDFKQVVMQDLDNMILEHYHHPAIVMWGTRLNESGDDDALYKATQDRARQLDASRPTMGVRWHTGSPLLEDVYGYNDYTPADQNGEFLLMEPQAVTKLPYKVPYLVSEHSGPILPTKPGDPWPRQEAFALLHARVLSKVLCREDYLGALGWCMFDYNTHHDHEQADKICFHGVADMFRVPKAAAWFYASQKDPSDEVVLQPASMVGRGERQDPAPFYIFTNCEYVDVTLSGDETRRWYPSIRFPGLAHPPIEVRECGEHWQGPWKGATIVGYIDGQEAARLEYSANPRLHTLDMRADDRKLLCHVVDETRVVCTFRDENGHRLLHHSGAATLRCQGDIEIIGPTLVPVLGGAIAFWVKTRALGTPGKAAVYLKTNRPELEEAGVEIELV